MIFKTINAKIEKGSYDIVIKNIDLASHHWGNEKKIAEYLDMVENLLFEKDTFDRKIVLHAIRLMKENHRVLDVKFYRIPEENKLILLATTAVHAFKPFDTFSREMSITFKKEKFSFAIIELLEKEAEEIKKGDKVIPDSWQFEERLTDRFNKLKDYA
jgi:ubiquinone/menaquinone biosynthesis C-methylase UbiE